MALYLDSQPVTNWQPSTSLTTWPSIGNSTTYSFNLPLNNMPDTTEKKPKLSADEKLIVAALKGTKTPDQITTLIAISRMTNRTPAAVMEIMDDVAELVTERIAIAAPAEKTA